MSKVNLMDTPYIIIEPKTERVPFILSVPHCGTQFPNELTSHYHPQMMAQPDDTDWFVHDLYNFASELGITIIHARYSRWVIDLNRDPESKPLYNDGRIITGLTTTTDFFGNSIYKSPELEPNREEIERRLTNYYWPYYEKLSALLAEQKEIHGHALLWDAHSIRHLVPTIRETVFPDMILGDNDGKTAHPSLINTALQTLGTDVYDVNHNTPFKGGHITRYFGNPDQNIHALQLEMNKILYMDDEELNFHPDRANKMRSILTDTFKALINQLNHLK